MYGIHLPRQSLKRLNFRVKSSDSIFFLLGLSPIVNLTLKVNLIKPFTWKILFNSIRKKDLKIKNFTLKSYIKQAKVCPPPPQTIFLFELNFSVKFPLLRILLFLSDLKSTILGNLRLYEYWGVHKIKLYQ